MGKPVGPWRHACLLLSGGAGPCLVAKVCLSHTCLSARYGERGKKEARLQGCRLSSVLLVCLLSVRHGGDWPLELVVCATDAG